MRKAGNLRIWLTACVPFLTNAPEKLQIYVDKGDIASCAGRSLSFEYRFTLSILICDYPGSSDDIVIPILAWIEREQPDLLQRSDGKSFEFEAEILDSNCVDLQIKLELAEPVVVTRRADSSGFDIAHPCPVPEAELYPGATALLRQGYAWTELVAETKDGEAVLVPGVPPEAGA